MTNKEFKERVESLGYDRHSLAARLAPVSIGTVDGWLCQTGKKKLPPAAIAFLKLLEELNR